MRMALAASELILSQNSAIYHLALTPDQLADTVITVGDPDRVSAVSKYFDRIEHKVQHREFVTHTGYIGKKRVSVVATGIGTDNIDIVLNELDALTNIDFGTRTVKDQLTSLNIIRLGTSGSLQPDIPVDSFVVSDFAIGLDNLLTFYQYNNNAEELELLRKFEAHTVVSKNKYAPYIASSSRRLSNQFQDHYHHGITVTCPGFYGPQGRVLRAHLAGPQFIDSFTTFNHNIRITNFEMETSALYGLGKILGHQCLSISTVVNNRINKVFSTDINRSVDVMIRNALAAIEHL